MPATAEPAPTPEPEQHAVASANPGAVGWWVGGALAFMLLVAVAGIVVVSKLGGEPSGGYSGPPVAQEVAAPEGWEAFRDSEGRAAFAVPPQWRFAIEVDPRADEPTPVGVGFEQVRTWVDGAPDELPVVYASVTVGTNLEVMAPDATAARFLEGFADGGGDFLASDPREFTTANGLDGAWVDLTLAAASGETDGAVIAVVNGRSVWILSTWRFGADLDDAVLEQIVETVRIDRGA